MDSVNLFIADLLVHAKLIFLKVFFLNKNLNDPGFETKHSADKKKKKHSPDKEHMEEG